MKKQFYIPLFVIMLLFALEGCSKKQFKKVHYGVIDTMKGVFGKSEPPQEKADHEKAASPRGAEKPKIGKAAILPIDKREVKKPLADKRLSAGEVKKTILNKDLQRQLDLGDRQSKKGNYRQAKKHYLTALDIDPASDLALKKLRSLPVVPRAAKPAPLRPTPETIEKKNLRESKKRGKKCLEAGNFDCAIKEFSDYIRKKPDDREAGKYLVKGYVAKISVAFNNKSFEQAAELLKELRAAASKYKIGLSGQADEIARIETGLKRIREKTERKESIIRDYNNEEYEKALIKTRKALQASPHDRDIRTWSEKLTKITGLIDRAESVLEKDPEKALDYYRQACRYIFKEDKRQSIGLEKRIINMIPRLKEKAVKKLEVEDPCESLRVLNIIIELDKTITVPDYVKTDLKEVYLRSSVLREALEINCN